MHVGKDAGTHMAEDLAHNVHAVRLLQAAGGLHQDPGQVWADQRLWQALQPQLERSSQLQASTELRQDRPGTTALELDLPENGCTLHNADNMCRRFHFARK